MLTFSFEDYAVALANASAEAHAVEDAPLLVHLDETIDAIARSQAK